jgi:hypothetical protein
LIGGSVDDFAIKPHCGGSTTILVDSPRRAESISTESAQLVGGHSDAIAGLAAVHHYKEDILIVQANCRARVAAGSPGIVVVIHDITIAEEVKAAADARECAIPAIGVASLTIVVGRFDRAQNADPLTDPGLLSKPAARGALC